jgi:5-(carboxyamino)imidazole ribonucleotide synthase
MKQCTIGLLGGGQLGRMLIQKAIDFDIRIQVMDADPSAPCSQIAHSFTVGDITDYEAVLSFGTGKELLTVEIENVNIDALEALEKQGVKVFPQPRVLKLIRDKGLQKGFYREHHIPTAPFRLIERLDELKQETWKPCVQKLRTGGYDGRGVQVMRKPEDIHSGFDEPSVVEELIPFDKELSVLVSRNKRGETAVFPVVECVFNPSLNLVEFLFAPADIPDQIAQRAQEIALNIIEQLDMVGLLAVELFLTKDGEILVNEIAPRPHNSGHHTIECNVTSQFEQHLRAILGLTPGDTVARSVGGMINLLGEQGHIGPAYYHGFEEVMAVSGAHVHLYGKQNTKPFRKMGHVTVTADNLFELREKISVITPMIQVVTNK